MSKSNKGFNDPPPVDEQLEGDLLEETYADAYPRKVQQVSLSTAKFLSKNGATFEIIDNIK